MSGTSYNDKSSILSHCSEKGISGTARKYGVNKYYIWRIVNDDGYIPPRSVARKLNYRLYKPRPRRAINLADAASAADTIRRHASAEFVAELVRLLEE